MSGGGPVAGLTWRDAGWWVRDRRTGAVVVAQSPNAAILVFVGATVLRWSPVTLSAGTDTDTALLWLGRGALTVWALDEVARGATPFRRVLGGVVLAYQAATLV